MFWPGGLIAGQSALEGFGIAKILAGMDTGDELCGSESQIARTGKKIGRFTRPGLHAKIGNNLVQMDIGLSRGLGKIADSAPVVNLGMIRNRDDIANHGGTADVFPIKANAGKQTAFDNLVEPDCRFFWFCLGSGSVCLRVFDGFDVQKRPFLIVEIDLEFASKSRHRGLYLFELPHNLAQGGVDDGAVCG